MRMVACRRCKRPSRTSLCARCHGETYGSPEYRSNSRMVLQYARHMIVVQGHVTCVICGQQIVDVSDVTTEHERSVSAGGDNSMDNLGPAHRRCNYSKRPSY